MFKKETVNKQILKNPKNIICCYFHNKNFLLYFCYIVHVSWNSLCNILYLLIHKKKSITFIKDGVDRICIMYLKMMMHTTDR